MSDIDEQRIAELLRRLPPAPEAWVAAAQQLPQERLALDSLVARAEADVAERQAILADLESALADAGLTPDAPLVEELRRRLAAP